LCEGRSGHDFLMDKQGCLFSKGTGKTRAEMVPPPGFKGWIWNPVRGQMARFLPCIECSLLLP
jgi:hypothetical protein